MVFVCVCVNIPKTIEQYTDTFMKARLPSIWKTHPFSIMFSTRNQGYFTSFLRVYPRVISAIEAKQPLVDDFFSGLSYC